MRNFYVASLVLVITSFCWSCKKDNSTPAIPVYTVPTTYSFTNVNDTDQLKLIAMADQIGAAVNLANTSPNTVVDSLVLLDMLNNVNNRFNDSALKLNTSGLSVGNYLAPAAKADMINYLDSVGHYSKSTVAGKNGTAGVLASSVTATKKYLLSPSGIFYSQVIKKTFQHGLFGYEMNQVMLEAAANNTLDNTNVIAGQGTTMEHHWDEGFGYFGVPINFPTSVTGLKYLASYSNQVEAGLQSNETIMNALLKGRAAISNKDYTTRIAQANIIVTTLELLNAASIVQEMKETDTNIDAGDSVAAYGTLSESLGFVRGLMYSPNPSRIISNASYTQLLALYDSNNPNSPNLYNFIGASVNTTAQIKAKTDAIRQAIGKIYGFTATQLSLQ